jgi:hypothetical protein
MLKFLRKSNKEFILNPAHSPTYYNLHRHLQALGWHHCTYPSKAGFSDKNFQFNEAATQCLEFKHLLAQLLNRNCPEIIPLTYCINDANWSKVLQNIASRFYVGKGRKVNEPSQRVWILKPALLNNGQEIKIFTNLNDLEAHFLSTRRLGGEHVLQQYLSNPHLLRPPSGHKYSIRMFAVMTNYAGCYLYPEGYFNVALQPFTPHEFTDLRSHLTNEHLHEGESNVVQIPSMRFDFFDLLYPQIKHILALTFRALQHDYPAAFSCRRDRCLAIFGFDFMADDNQRLWLLEANHGPCFPVDEQHPLQKYLYHAFWQAFIKSFVLPIARNESPEKINYKLFEKIQ